MKGALKHKDAIRALGASLESRRHPFSKVTIRCKALPRHALCNFLQFWYIIGHPSVNFSIFLEISVVYWFSSPSSASRLERSANFLFLSQRLSLSASELPLVTYQNDVVFLKKLPSKHYREVLVFFFFFGRG